MDDGFDGLRTWLGIGVRPDVRWFLSPPSPLCSPIWGNVASSWQLFIKVKVKVCVCVRVCIAVLPVGLPCGTGRAVGHSPETAIVLA